MALYSERGHNLDDVSITEFTLPDGPGDGGADDVSKPVPGYLAMVDCWDLVAALDGGTPTMREDAEKWLPRFEAEDSRDYRTRLERTVLFNVFGRTLSTLVGKPFSEALRLDDAPSEIETFAEDVDGSGTSLHLFARELFEAALRDLVTYVLVDYPPTAPGLTLAQERAIGARPYLVHIDARRVIGWRTAVENGREVFEQLRYTTASERPAGAFGVDVVDQIRVLKRGALDVETGARGPVEWAVYEAQKAEDGKVKWLVVDRGHYRGVTEIPVVAVNAKRIGDKTGKPPLLDLAYLNLAHYQSSSDQASILHTARVPVLFYAGADPKQSLELGPNRSLMNASPDAKLSWTEIKGTGIAAGEADLESLENRMRIMGLELLALKPVQVTATQRALDQIEQDSDLGAMCKALESSLMRVLEYVAEWLSVDIGATEVSVNQEFGASALDGQSETLRKIREMGEITQRTFLEQLQTIGILNDDMDVDAELMATADERETMFAGPIPPEPDE